MAKVAPKNGHNPSNNGHTSNGNASNGHGENGKAVHNPAFCQQTYLLGSSR